MEISSKKCASFHIYCFTVYLNIGSIVVKRIIQYFVNLEIMWAMKLVESMVSYIGAEV